MLDMKYHSSDTYSSQEDFWSHFPI